MCLFYSVESSNGEGLNELLHAVDEPTAAIDLYQPMTLDSGPTSRRVVKLLHHRQSTKTQSALKRVR